MFSKKESQSHRLVIKKVNVTFGFKCLTIYILFLILSYYCYLFFAIIIDYNDGLRPLFIHIIFNRLYAIPKLAYLKIIKIDNVSYASNLSICKFICRYINTRFFILVERKLCIGSKLLFPGFQASWSYLRYRSRRG